MYYMLIYYIFKLCVYLKYIMHIIFIFSIYTYIKEIDEGKRIGRKIAEDQVQQILGRQSRQSNAWPNFLKFCYSLKNLQRRYWEEFAFIKTQRGSGLETLCTMEDRRQDTGNLKTESLFRKRSLPYRFIDTSVVSSHLDQLKRALDDVESDNCRPQALWATQVRLGIRGKGRALNKSKHSEPWDSTVPFLLQSFVPPSVKSQTDTPKVGD